MHLCISLDNHRQFIEVGFDLDQQVLIDLREATVPVS